MKVTRSSISRVVTAVAECPDLKKATLYLNETTVVKATRVYKFDGRKRTDSVCVTFGKPNYAERKFIRLCGKAGQPLPIRKLQLKWWPKKQGAR